MNLKERDISRKLGIEVPHTGDINSTGMNSKVMIRVEEMEFIFVRGLTDNQPIHMSIHSALIQISVAVLKW